MELNNYIVSETFPIIEAMKLIDINAHGIVFVCDNLKLLATITDGDIRRHILVNGDLNSPVKDIANYSPHYINEDNDVTNHDIYMNEKSISALPILNFDGNIIDIKFLNIKQIIVKKQINIPVVIMAGGKGTRLYPYTQILPKPLIPIGEKTITEHIMDRFEAFGCKHFDIIVNYKRNLIKSYFADNEDIRDINFIDEYEFMGTGGGLKLLSEKYDHTFFMSNCDVLIEEDYSEILKFHQDNKNIITIVSATKNITFPYGTIEITEQGQVKAFKEKPSFSFNTNTGFYVIEPSFLNMIPSNMFIHITDVIQKCIDEDMPVGIYPISERAWLDMGQISELENMKIQLL